MEENFTIQSINFGFEGTFLHSFIADKKKKQKRDLISILILVYISALLISGIFGDMGFIKNYKLYKQNALIKQKISSLEKENKNLRREIDNLMGNRRYIEKIAREELNMTREDEIVFIFSEEKTGSSGKGKGQKQ